MAGPLTGVRVVELAGLGPAPFATMLLADLGAEVVRVDRGAAAATLPEHPNPDVTLRGRRSVALDLKHPLGRQVVLDLVTRADVLIEGFRPGVTERLGIGPDDAHRVNPRLVYGRMTGWGQDGPLAPRAGHDLTYIALTGALDASRRAGERPVPPVNLLGDFGGGALYLVVGVLAALVEARSSGAGQVVDAAIVDGVASLTGFLTGLQALGGWNAEPGGNLLDGGAPFYDTYTCLDGREIAVGALEPQFYAELLDRTGIDLDAHPELRPENRLDPATWVAARRPWAELFATRTRDQWAELLADTDACVGPVLSMAEARQHPHLRERGTFTVRDEISQPSPAPRFSRTSAVLDRPPPWPGQHTDEILLELGWDTDRIAEAHACRAVTGSAAPAADTVSDTTEESAS